MPFSAGRLWFLDLVLTLVLTAVDGILLAVFECFSIKLSRVVAVLPLPDAEGISIVSLLIEFATWG